MVNDRPIICRRHARRRERRLSLENVIKTALGAIALISLFYGVCGLLLGA
jgi:hypothetical protein